MSQPSNQQAEDVQNAAKTEPPSQPESSAAEPSGYKGGNPATAGPGPTAVKSSTPENALGHINPSAPEDANATPGSTTLK